MDAAGGSQKSTMNNIPTSLDLPEMGQFEIQVDEGVKVKVSVVYSAEQLDSCISELSNSLKKSSSVNAPDLVAFDIKLGSSPFQIKDRRWIICSSLLILCIGTRCQIVRLRNLKYSNTQYSILKKFFNDKNAYCFVGIEGNLKKLQELPYMLGLKIDALELGHLAAMVLKKPGMERCGLPELASEVGLCYEEPRNVTFSDLGARVLSKEQVEFFIHDAYATYRIAGNLLKLRWD